VNPYAFTEQGVAMLSAVLHSETAVRVSIQIINAFVEMRKWMNIHGGLMQRMDSIERKQMETDRKFELVFNALEEHVTVPKQGVFFEGQIFDAYLLASNIIQKAKKSIFLIDNYIDVSVLVLLGKKEMGVKATIFTKNISSQLALDISRANAQFPVIEAKIFDKSHDRFLIVDETEVYLLGASLKDLGKKWFGFSKIDRDSVSVLNRIKEN
jgi:hypothetical protein